jgi:hypothetical protein
VTRRLRLEKCLAGEYPLTTPSKRNPFARCPAESAISWLPVVTREAFILPVRFGERVKGTVVLESLLAAVSLVIVLLGIVVCDTHVMKGRSGISLRGAILGGSIFAVGCWVLYSVIEPIRQDKARAHCASNLKGIGLALMQYAEDYDQTLPRSWYGKDAGLSDPRTNYKWMDAIFPYVKAEKYFVCPNDRTSKSYRYRSSVNYGSYLFNNAYFATGDALTPPDGQKLADISDNNTVLVMDGENDFRFAWANVAQAPVVQDGRLANIVTRHSRQFRAPMTLWVSGLVQSYGLRQVIAEKQVKGQRVYSGFTIESD